MSMDQRDITFFEIPKQSDPGEESMTLEKFNNSCQHLIKSNFANEPYAQLVTVPPLHRKFCQWNIAFEKYQKDFGDGLSSDKFQRQRELMNRAHQFIIRE